ncbi:MAG: SDR family oxidoreductase [Bacteroidia bacterium]|nr:SDR family oxidoreductase [Bacteroidia bacterium]
MDLNLKGKNAFVCGSTRGIGKATAEQLAELGANVTLISRNEDKLSHVAAELPVKKGQEHDYLAADFSRPEDLKDILNQYLKSTKKRIHILVNNTGGPPAGPALSAEPEEFRKAFIQHLVCNQILVQAVVEGMKAEHWGRIINVISTSVKQPLKNLGVSNTIRGAVANWAKTLANELGADGITVNNVLPGATETERLAEIITNQVNRTGQARQEITDDMKSIIPAGRFGTPTEVASAIAFLASPAASYINGINLPVDGGRTKSL